jgi:hypothetical protein
LDRFKHETTVGGQALNVVKLNDGLWDTIPIWRGDHDFLAKKQVRVKKGWYPQDECLKLEPLERRKLFITQHADGARPSKFITTVSVDHSYEISTLTDTVNSLHNSVDAPIGVNTTQNHRIANPKQIQKDAEIFDSNDDTSDNKDVTLPSPSALALARGKLAGGKKSRKKK